jgi:mono/diheme cytochrome c family protein
MLAGCRSTSEINTGGPAAADGAAVEEQSPTTIDAGPRTTAAAVYSAEQAARGKTVFERVCLECHRTDNFTASGFRNAWEGKSVRSLFNTVRSTMPETNPGGLSNQEYADVITYILEINRLPTGAGEMPASAEPLADIEIRWPASSNNIP